MYQRKFKEWRWWKRKPLLGKTELVENRTQESEGANTDEGLAHRLDQNSLPQPPRVNRERSLLLRESEAYYDFFRPCPSFFIILIRLENCMKRRLMDACKIDDFSPHAGKYEELLPFQSLAIDWIHQLDSILRYDCYIWTTTTLLCCIRLFFSNLINKSSILLQQLRAHTMSVKISILYPAPLLSLWNGLTALISLVNTRLISILNYKSMSHDRDMGWTALFYLIDVALPLQECGFPPRLELPCLSNDTVDLVR